MAMKAVWLSSGELSVRVIDDPRRCEGEAVIRVRMAGVCKTDLELIKGYMGFTGVLGHEFVGEVVDAEDITWIGRRVVGEINCPCYRCSFCVRGLSRHCPNRSVLGIEKRNGVFAEYTALPMRNLHVVPEGVPDEVAVFTEPVAACFRIVEQVHFQPSDFVVVLGDGRMGQLISQVIKPYVGRLVCVGKYPYKLSRLCELGIETALVDRWTERNVDVVIDATGNPEAQQIAIDMLRPQGVLVIKSTIEKPTVLNVSKLVVNEITVIGSRCGPFEPALKSLADNTVRVDYMVSHVFGFEDVLEAIRVAQGKDCLKVLIDFR